MKKLWAKHQKFMSGNAGFSLVELIIVIAIMAALVAIIAPKYIKYVSQSRDSALQSSAEEVLSVAKAEYAMGNLTGTGDIAIAASGIELADTLAYDDVSTEATEDKAAFIALCDFDANKSASTVTFTITIGGTANAPTFTTSW